MNIRNLIASLFLILQFPAAAQHVGMTFQAAEKQGIRITYLDSIYKSAIHTDTALAVFKTDEEQEKVAEHYTKLLQDFGKYLAMNNFKWDKPTRCFNRIYFSADGTVDYFLYNFLGKPEDKPSDVKQTEFNRLLNNFIQHFKFGMQAKEKFAQCSPTTYMPGK